METVTTIFLIMLSLVLIVPAVVSLMMLYALIYGFVMYIKEEKKASVDVRPDEPRPPSMLSGRGWQTKEHSGPIPEEESSYFGGDSRRSSKPTPFMYGTGEPYGPKEYEELVTAYSAEGVPIEEAKIYPPLKNIGR